jgi:ribosomal protein L11 methyltransferase
LRFPLQLIANWPLFTHPSRLASQPTIEDHFLIALDPGMAFGAGIHPTTHPSLEALEDTIRSGDIVIEPDCWSGILRIAAAFL